MKKIYYSLFLLLSLFIWASCDKGGEEIVDLKYEGRAVSVSSISPVAGYVGEELTINGEQFGVSPELMKVFIGENQTEIVSCSEERLVVKVPEGATTGKIILNLLGSTYVSELTYEVLGKPSVTAISPIQGFPDDEITITGNNLGSTLSAVKLIFTGTSGAAQVVSCENTKIVVKVPVKATTGSVDLTISKQHVNTPLSGESGKFTVLQHASFTGVSAESGYRGAKITLQGEGFVGTDEKPLKVYFGDVEAEVVSYTDTEIVIIVPEEATDGDNGVMVETAYELIEAVHVFNVLPSPKIINVSSSEEYIGAEITITGENFPEKAENVKVTFGDGEAVIVSNSKTDLVVRVPAPGEGIYGEVDLTVSMSDVTFYTGKFTVKETPYIISVTSANVMNDKLVQVGDEITVTGRGLTSDALVTIGGIEVEPIFINNTEFKVTIPEGFTGGAVVLKYEEISIPITSDDELVLLTDGMDISEFVLQNYKQPFIPESGTAGTANPVGWLYSDNFKNEGMAWQNGNTYLHLQTYGNNKKENGKLYQVKSLPAGKYRFIIDVAESFLTAGRFTVRFLVTKGNNTFPDYAREENTSTGKHWVYDDPNQIVLADALLSNLRVVIGTTPEKVEVEVELAETTEVTMGFLTMVNSKAGVKVSAISTVWLGE
ncbi:IPT/TIG domain-containing protein [uncultured Bacteroides sp.]|uniref:IPT/TIG domain-containing protein n=1 Tax=uncultured Bacteroides sp. TaxID=162156 RepID=UPI0025D71058|nr:IPT/TIG domain-containing protein [uncultured Bacteroides sp.]